MTYNPTTQPLACIILAAGAGTRMKSSTPKVLHPVAHKPMIHHVLDSVITLQPKKTVVVVPTENDAIRNSITRHLPDNIHIAFAEQTEQKGTAHAVSMALPHLEDFTEGNVLILYGDTPLIEANDIQKLTENLSPTKQWVSVQGFYTDHPTGYGRLITSGNGHLDAIIEEADATNDQRNITLCNAGMMGFSMHKLASLLSQINNTNKKQEYYLTDAIAIANQEKPQSVGYVVIDESHVLGVNSREDLAHVETVFQHKMRQKMMQQGVTLLDPSTIYFAADTQIASDVIIHPNVVFGPGVTIASHTEILPFCHLEQATIGNHVRIGPFARIRPGSTLENHVRIGNFVEIKNSHISSHVKANHLAYLGDAEIGAETNIGAGTITCNYDGFNKHRTTIGNEVSVGANCSLIAPITIDSGAIIGAGSVISQPVNKDTLAVSRSPQQNLEGKARSIRNKKRG